MMDLLFFLFPFEDEEDHHDEEDGNRHTQQDAQQHLAYQPETKGFEEEQSEMVDKHHEKSIPQEPNAVQLSKVGLLYVLKLLVARDESDDGRPTESHQRGGASVKSRCSCKQVDGQAQDKAQDKKLPFWCVKRQQHYENQVNVWVNVSPQADVIDDQHLKEHEHHETDDL